MTVECSDKNGYLFIEVNMKVRDTYTDEEIDVAAAWPIYALNSVSVRFVIEAIKSQIQRLWMHELQEWCKIGDDFLFSDPHA